MWRYSYKALPPPLYALRDAAKKRGVICQITSEGMYKRDRNPSRFDRRTNTFIWFCEFAFHDFEKDQRTVIETTWGNERHHLGDIMRYAWATNPPLPCFHINKRYNKASTYVGAPQGDPEGAVDPTAAEAQPELPDTKTTEEEERKSAPSVERESSTTLEAHNVPVDVVPLNEEEAKNKEFIDDFTEGREVVILARAERLTEKKYFLLDPLKTLNENLRLVFFVNEYPEFLVVHKEDLHHFALVTESDKELIRTSFRAKPKEKRERPKKSDLTEEEKEKLGRLPCRMFLAGKCQDVEECPFLHCTREEVPVCRSFFKFGQCPKGERCSFRHDEEAIHEERKRQREMPSRGRGRGRGRGRFI
ncbi:hypothetical protein AGDE_07847 [Angomonas deanei]|uniref:Zinc finger C-x8-C-x5-C-x3-H type (And similar), putative n=1 Tax=Angomonas deanei TaxID=59799 RepID=A0A7G2CJD0_9TRYP|nr:hypothetical protein AGDE_07847 [Angomonas deanei]CAD2219041.1 Zinc finger C-x8-C-x5-C-x3-H type (and similar), putative [Angomonas deanei]|eukprot:EPY34572.1 hypothetical protein AGDE_07847 [Angomonas deanei]